MAEKVGLSSIYIKGKREKGEIKGMRKREEVRITGAHAAQQS